MINEDIKAAAYDYVNNGWNIIPCKFKDKQPLLKGWSNRVSPTTKEDLNSWFNKYENINLGLPLGDNNLVVAIDLDGSKAQKELEKISKGEIPATLEFTTPGGGYRYLYRLPSNIETKIWCRKLAGEHEELRILAQGEQTIIPPSIHPNKGIYKWEVGKDPNSIEIALAPDWLLKLVTKETRNTTPSNSSYPLGDVNRIYSQCKWFKHCKEDSRTLSYDEWINCLMVINTCENSEESAIEYSKNYPMFREEETLEKLKCIQDKGYKPAACYSIKSKFASHCEGCTLGVGSPATLGIGKTREELEAVGFYFEDGSLKGLNGNKFAAYLNNRLEILFTDSGRFYIYLDNYWKYVDDNFLSRICRDILHEFFPNYWSVVVESNYMEALKRVAVRVSKLDSDKTKVNLINGIFDLNSYEIKIHTPLIRSSTQLPIKYSQDAKCTAFEKFLEDIFEGDKERIKLVQEMFGYCLTAETSAQKAFMLYGRGSNGKSMLAEILIHLVGKPNTSAVSLNELDNPFARYEIVNKLLNVATENEISDRGLNTTYFKSIVAGDPIRVEKKFEQGFMYQPTCKLVFCLNNLPYSKDKSWGFQRRLILIPFTKVFDEESQDTKNYGELRDKLLSELDGIFLWALDGLQRLRKNKFKFSKSEAVNIALEDYKTEVNPYYNFAKDRLEQGLDTDIITNETLSSAFKEWATKNGHKNLATASNQKIIREIRHVLLDMKIAIKYGDKIKVNGKRCTLKVRFKKGEAVLVQETA